MNIFFKKKSFLVYKSIKKTGRRDNNKIEIANGVDAEEQVITSSKSVGCRRIEKRMEIKVIDPNDLFDKEGSIPY